MIIQPAQRYGWAMYHRSLIVEVSTMKATFGYCILPCYRGVITNRLNVEDLVTKSKSCYQEAKWLALKKAFPDKRRKRTSSA